MAVDTEEPKKEPAPGGAEDERLEFIFEYLSKSLRLKQDKWAKMMSNDELKYVVMEFLERTTADVLVMMLSPAGVLTPVLGFPTNAKGKSSYFIRKRKEPVTKDNLRDLLIFGDMAPRPVDELAVLVDEVFMPLLVNPVNHRGWPAVVAEDVKKHLYGLKCDLYEVRGRINGQTLLPMPLNVAKVYQVHRDIVESNGEVVDVHLKSAIEGVVIKWASQTSQVLSEDPSTAFSADCNPEPKEEVNFWTERRKNLEGMYNQLRDPRVKKMGEILELTESAYFPCFKTLFRNVVAALTEVRDICVYLKPVETLMEQIATLEFPDVAEMLAATMHTVCLLWGNSRYYCTSPRIILLIKEISNQLIRQCSDYLDPSSLFQGELDEAQERVALCIETLQDFKEVFEESRGNLGSGYFKNSEPVMWNFKSSIVFDRLNKYIERLEKIQTVFDAGVEYSKLEKVEIGGLKGRILGQKVEKLFDEFKTIFSGFTRIEYDPLNPDDGSFERDERVFKENMKDLEGRLAAIITQAFDDCCNFESLSKLIQVAGSLMDRPSAKEDMKERMPRILEVYSKDLDAVKVIFDQYLAAKEENGFFEVDCYLPPTAGAMTFVLKLRSRIQAPMEFFNDWENPILETADMEHVRHKYEEMKEKLDGLWDSLYSEWANRVPGEVNEHLSKTLLTRHEDNTIETNFAPELVAALRECRYLQFLDIEDIPAPAKELFDRSEELHLWVTTLNRIVEWYNEILNRCIPVEFDLIREEMNGIDGHIKELQDKLNWKSDGVWPHVENIRDLTKALHGRVLQAQANVDHIKGLLDNFAHVPLFERDEKAGLLLGLADRTARVNKRFVEVRVAGDQIHLKMDENYKLFHNIPLEEEQPEAPVRKKRLKKRFDEDGNEIPWEEGEEEWESYDEEDDVEEEHVEEEEEQESSSDESSESSEELWSSDSETGGRTAVKKQAVEGWDMDTWAEDGQDDQDEWAAGQVQPAPTPPPEDGAAEEDAALGAGAGSAGGVGSAGGAGNAGGAGSAAGAAEGAAGGVAGSAAGSAVAGLGSAERPASTVASERGSAEPAGSVAEPAAESSSVDGADRVSRSSTSTATTRESARTTAASSSGATVSLDLSVSEDVLPALPEEPTHSAEWLAYLEHIDDMVMQKLTQAVQSSVDVFFEETNPDRPRADSKPLFEVNLELKDPDIVFNPSLDDEARKGFYRLVEGLLYDVVHMSELISRVAQHNPRPHYRKDIHQNTELNSQLQEILMRVRTVIAEAVDECDKMNVHSYLWMDDRDELFGQFLKYGHYLTPDELDELAAAEEGTTPIKETPPDLEKFKELIELYEGLYKEIDEIPTEKVFHTWFRVNVKPFKQALLNTVCKWSNMIKQHLVDHVINSLRGLAEFNEEAERELSREVKEGDYDALLAVMNYLGKVRDRRDKTDTMFEPIKDTIELLKTYDVEFPEEIYVQLQELPDAWNNVKKIAIAVRTAVSPFITHEMNQIRRRITVLDARQLAYREAFKKMPFFRFDCKNCYDEIDQAQKEICELEEYIGKISEQAALFEVNVPDFRGVKMCRKEIKMIKQLWDYVNVVQSSLDEWKTTPWREIEVDNMDMECKKFGKELRTLDKEMRGWDTFISLEALLKNMVTSLRAVSELQNPAIRERHWRQLMAATKVKIVIDENTVLDDLLQLNLHLFEDEVKTIVDKSVKEMSMEKVLRELDATWREQEFEREEHPRTGVQLIRTSEELIETLEENQVQLQNMMSSKFIAFFLTEVSEWQSRLGNADAVISIWMEVQRTWCHLESIFVGSEDIRSQLPEDCTRFDMVDVEFKKLLEELTVEPNIVRFTNKKGLYEKLEELQAHLTKCEKALAEYLETKRLAYPRFYFVSSADLLDILSNGNQPALVARHLTKLYDSMAKLKMEGSSDNKATAPKKAAKAKRDSAGSGSSEASSKTDVKAEKADSGSKLAVGMWAKDGEYVQFSQKCDCDGKVEVWLNRVTDTMRVTGRHFFREAVNSYDEKPREQWIFDYPAQTALVGTQIWWTTEVNIAFSRLEEGYENALKDYNRKQVQQLNTLISLLLGDLSGEDRQKIMTICTIDVHSRDVVAKLIAQKVESSTAFQWQSQLRHRWDDKIDDCFCNICDAQFRYDYEYLGCTPRLVITPLTDRCYITLTQSLHLIMGGAPAGPAGTGKTETTKDLGRAMGVMVYVFNCSEQMDYKSCGNIYKGLAQTGAWGCFDEFNRISVEVLSVVAVQVKTVLDAIRFKKTRFSFLGETITLTPTVGMFITMNPGYAGRTELPENLKVLFRPCAMVVPDFELICEIMLVAEGFQEARLLARKFITLYTLCRELLSKQDHYDWGLRAIKSVLVVAGSLKRGDRQRPEDQVLMRALRDFNVPKIVTDDLPVFLGLIGDLFPALDVPRKRDLDFEKSVRLAAMDLQLQPEDNFILKVVQLVELLEVRHSVFIIGFAGTGKSMVWKTLFKTYQNMKMKPFVSDLNPKAVTNDELFGVINPSTREWKDGLFSVLMRDIANMSGDGPRWMMLDGDIDPMWIESLNTVMDDNKVLTLASNERIAMTKSMRLLFEISNLRTATPATVSRAGILYINPTDLGWNPYVTSWIDKRDQPAEKANLLILFDKYVPPTLEALRTKFKKITPVPEIAHVKMLCDLLDCFLTDKNLPPECPKEWYEIYFVFSCVWAFGSVLFQDQLVDWRNEFHKWWVNEFKVVKFPAGGTVFNYFIDPDTKKFLPWSEMIVPYEFDPDTPLQATLVSTSETTRLRVFMDLLLPRRIPVMLVGGSGSGKTVIVNACLGKLPDSYMVTNVPFNFYTTSEMLQKVLEKPLEKKAGRNYGPPGSKSMIYFIDDMNMPEVDKYFTVQPHTLIRQHLDYNHWYDRSKLTLKDIHNCQYVSCMNPTAGSFTIDPRLQRHFFVFAVSFPGEEALTHIYTNILQGHLTQSVVKFNPAVVRLVPSLVQSALFLHSKMSTAFLPTAVKFHYLFNLRDLANVFQGILFSSPDCLPDHSALVRLWVHEATRVYHDKLVDDSDRDQFKKLLMDAVKKVEGVDEAAVLEKPIIYVHFAEGIGETKYLPLDTWEALNKLLQDALAQYNDMVASMNLVLFEDAMDHICRICRILMGPRGNALLVGVGGSGKQSLTRLAAFICNLDVFQVQLRKGYAIADLKAELAVLYQKAGLKGAGLLFLMTDAQVPDERFLVIINDMLASGEIPDLFADDEVENIINQMRGEVKGVGIQDTRENCWKFFINRVRCMLKTVLCFSPVGATLRTRSRKFPAITNCTAINWFNEWPYEALQSVSLRFLSELEALPENLRKSVSEFMSYVHASVNEMSQAYLVNERRYNYTTPKSFLEQIELYGKLLTSKSDELSCKIVRLQNGLEKLASCGEQVDGLKEVLAVQEVEVRQKNAAADELIVVVSKETEKVSKEKAIAAEEERKVIEKEEEVSAQKKICEQDLKAAEPALIAAAEALNTLNKNNLSELKALASPPQAVTQVLAAAMVLMSPKGKVPKERGWKESKAFMGKVDTFLDNLLHYDKENIHPDVVKAIKPYLNNKEFVPELIRTKSTAAAGLCAWCINIMAFHDVYVNVEPKRRALNEKNAEWVAARQRLAELKSKLDVLEGELAVLTDKFEVAVAEKLKCQEEADSTAETIDLANRLVTGLGSESVRWQESIANFQKKGTTLPGDMLLVTAFISYVGGFTRSYRVDLQHKKWLPFLKTLNPPIPLTEDLDPLSMLTDDAQVAAWNNEGLPNDSMSIENATVIMNSARWPLMIDPQLQGIKWIKNRYGKHLKVVRLGQKSYLDVIERSISRGKTVLIEFIGETMDAVLEPLLSRALINKGRAIKMGDKEIDYNPKFRLILQTKLANPHYKPEMQAQTTLINFTVTRDGLEEQLLAEVVKAERPDLESLRMELTTKQNSYKIEIKNLEDELLQRLSSAGDNVLSDKALVLNLERTKRTAEDIVVKVEESKVTGQRIDEAREHYRPAASRAALLYFILNDLHKINPVYQFSLKAYTVVFHRGIQLAVPADTLQARVNNLIDSITYQTYIYTSRGLFEADKLIFMMQMAVQMDAAENVLLKAQEVEPVELDFLLRYPFVTNLQSPVDFLSDTCWGGIVALSNMAEFKNLDKDIEGAAKRWRTFVESEAPEKEKFPGDWKGKSALQRLCMMRALRPDRMIYATQAFIEEKLGAKFTESRSIPFEKSFEESSPTTPTFFILSPGVDPLKDVEKLGRKMGFTSDKRNFHNVSLGQGQEPVAEKAMKRAAKKGHWVILQNIHLVANWLPSLEKRMDKCAEKPHDTYRLFMSAEPAPAPEFHILPQGVLESSIKITNEPPTGMHANLHKALDNFSQETLEMSTKEAEFKSILFALCYFHAVVAERRKFAAQGWNRVYPFNFGDLTISVNVLYNYLEANTRVPWEDLRYLFGEIMYGGHITDDWDRRLCATYLEEYLQAELVDGDLMLAPGFTSPPNSDYSSYHQYIDDFLPPESPMLYGLHPNAEISSLTATSEKLFKTVFEMQPRDAMAGSGATVSRDEKVKQMLCDILERLPEPFNMAEMMGKVEDRTPYVIVAFQECERMNQLMAELRQTLVDLDLGLKGELTITPAMENLEQCLFIDKVPENWSAKAYPSMLTLSSWFADLQLRLKELENWTQDFIMPGSVWLAGFFNPQSFLTAIMQSMARKNEWPLDKMCLQCDVTKKGRDDFSQAPREGANVHGLYMEGARWDVGSGCIVDSRHKELFPLMPVIYVRAITQDKQETRNVYQCPVYKTRQRGPTFVWTFNLKTRDKPTKWTLAGTALLLSL